MDFRLSEDGKVRYSPMERRIFTMLNSKPASSIELTSRYYGRAIPFNGRNIMGATLRRLSDKVNFNRERFKVVRSRRAGQKPIKWHVATRSRD